MPFTTPGNLLYIPNYVFKNNGGTRDKYFLVLAYNQDEIVVASLPTSQDYVPDHLELNHGCLDSPDDYFNCYHFEVGKSICDNGFSFPKATYLYGEWATTFSTDDFDSIEEYEVKGQLDEDELNAIIECFKASIKVKNKVKRLL